MPESFSSIGITGSRRQTSGKHYFARAILLFFSLSSVFLLAVAAFADPPSPFAGDKFIGQRAPDFTATDINGNSVTLSSYKGRVILLKFWATWCGPCRAEIPSANKLNSMMSGRGLVVLSITTDHSEATVKEFLKKNPVNYTIIIDKNLTIAKNLYRAYMVPSAFLIDRRGVVVKKYFGEHDWTAPELVKEIESFL